MLRHILSSCLLLIGVAFAGQSLAAEDPTMHQIYQAAEAGRLDAAQAMMSQVLRDHPNSGKAHYVEAELLAKQGRMASARSELATAERLAPGLPFAKPQAVRELEQRIAGTPASAFFSGAQGPSFGGTARGIPLGLLLIGIALITALVYFIRAMSRRNASALAPAGGPAYAPAPVGTAGAAAPMGTSGIGSGILGGLATGAALGAGMVAGESLMHRLTGGGGAPLQSPASLTPSADWDNGAPDGMGGTDFGVSDASSWDDGSVGGGDDWS